MMADIPDTLMRMAAFDRVRRLGEIHDHLTATELKPGFVYLRACRRFAAGGIHPMGRSRSASGIYDRQEAGTKIDAVPSMVRAFVE